MDKINILQDLGNGKFKALKAGEVTITATAQDGSGMKLHAAWWLRIRWLTQPWC